MTQNFSTFDDTERSLCSLLHQSCVVWSSLPKSILAYLPNWSPVLYTLHDF